MNEWMSTYSYYSAAQLYGEKLSWMVVSKTLVESGLASAVLIYLFCLVEGVS